MNILFGVVEFVSRDFELGLKGHRGQNTLDQNPFDANAAAVYGNCKRKKSIKGYQPRTQLMRRLIAFGGERSQKHQ